MMRVSSERGFSIVELLTSLTILSLVMGGVAGLLIHNAQINRTEQMTVDVQANARNCLSMVVQALRSAGWDPQNAGLATVTLDPTPSDPVNFIEIFADLNEDGDTDDDHEQVLIQHTNNRVEWRTTNDTSDPFVILAENISNDSDGDGIVENMFVPDSTTDPTRITVRVTARSATPDPRSREYLRYTVASDVVLRRSF